MKARPILMSGLMVRALLDGRKTQTRRVVKPQPVAGEGIGRCHYVETGWSFTKRETAPSACRCRPVRCPYGNPNDLLWVREAWSPEYFYFDKPPRNIPSGESDIWLWADGNPTGDDFTKPKPSIHMPRWVSRLTLELTDVRVERLQDISEADAVAEGIADGGCLNCGSSSFPEPCGCPSPESSFTDGFVHLWHQIHGELGWHANPWVWVLSFRVHQKNVDDVLKELAA